MGWILSLIILLFLFTVSLCLYSVGRVSREREARKDEGKKEGRKVGCKENKWTKVEEGRKKAKVDGNLGMVEVGQKEGKIKREFESRSIL